MILLDHSGGVAAASLIAGYSIARATKVRALGGAVLLAGGVLAGRTWIKAGIGPTLAMSTIYLGAFGLSHPLAKKIGAWPAVLTAAAVTGAAGHVLVDSRATT